MTAKTHFTRTHERWHGAKGRTFVSRCNCGWESRPQANLRDAEERGDDHVGYIARLGLDDGQCDRCDGAGFLDGRLCNKCGATGRLDNEGEEN